MYLLIEDDHLLEKYNTICDQVSADMKKEFDSEPLYNKNYLKTKIILIAMKIQIFTIKNLKLDSNHACLAVIDLDSALKKNDNYYSASVFKIV